MLDRKIVDELVNTTITAPLDYEARPGERIERSGVYGEYYLGEYVGTLHVFPAGGIFPDRHVGVSFCLHADF